MRRSTLTAWAVAFALGAWTCVAFADTIDVKIQFPFKAAGKDMPAGNYQVVTDGQMEILKLVNNDTGKATVLPFSSRLSERDGQTLLVFDKSGDQYFLSEIYFPGIDGFELKAATGKHTHVKVKGVKR